jgi:predicted ribosomally synthesized peptide with SipW-like signal peptide
MNDIRGRAPIKLFAIGATALAVVGISLGTMLSLAIFTDDADVDNNTFSTGTIDLSTTPTTALFTVPSMMPGDSAYGQLNVANSGSGQLRYAMTSSSTDPDGKALAGAVDLEVREKAAGTCAADFTGTVVMSTTDLASAAFGDVSAGQDTGDRVLDASASENLCFKASLPGSTDDSYQDADTVTTFTFHAEQTANNS